jgi:LEA14-like dessication related protein
MKKYLLGTAIIGGIGLMAYSIYRYFTTQAELLKNFEYKILGVKLTRFSFSAINGTLKLLFTSTADLEIEVKEFILDFYLNGERVGYLQESSQFIIPARGTTPIDLDFTINPQLIIGNALDLITFTAQQRDATFKVSGFAKVKSGFINVTLPIEYETSVREMLK